jgi:hypothetical protein
MRTPERQPDPGRYGHHCGSGQLATYEVQPVQRQPDPGRYGHHCGSGQLATYEVQPEEQRGLHVVPIRAQTSREGRLDECPVIDASPGAYLETWKGERARHVIQDE